jgi:hypothetical protein
MSNKVSFSKLADVLGVPLTYTNGVSVTGCASGVIKLPSIGSLKLNMSVVGHFINGTCGVLLHVIGDLYIIAGINPDKGVISIHLVNSAKVEIGGVNVPPATLVDTKCSLRTIVDKFKPAIEKSFILDGNSWCIYKLPN